MGSGNTSHSKVKAAETNITNHYNQVLSEKEQEIQKKEKAQKDLQNQFEETKRDADARENEMQERQKVQKIKWHKWNHN